jgi:hypothetical protein
MKILVKDPQFDYKFKKAVYLAKKKGVRLTATGDKDGVFIKAVANGRLMGKMRFEFIENECILREKLIIEKGFYPFEAIIARLIVYLKRRKPKVIII